MGRRSSSNLSLHRSASREGSDIHAAIYACERPIFPPNFLLLHLGATRSIPTVAEAKTPSHSLGDRSDLKAKREEALMSQNLVFTSIHVYVGLSFTR